MILRMEVEIQLSVRIGETNREDTHQTGTVTNWINSAIIAVKELYNGKTVWI